MHFIARNFVLIERKLPELRQANVSLSILSKFQVMQQWCLNELLKVEMKLHFCKSCYIQYVHAMQAKKGEKRLEKRDEIGKKRQDVSERS